MLWSNTSSASPHHSPKARLGRRRCAEPRSKPIQRMKEMDLKANTFLLCSLEIAPLRKTAQHQASARPTCGPCMSVNREAPLGQCHLMPSQGSFE